MIADFGGTGLRTQTLILDPQDEIPSSSFPCRTANGSIIASIDAPAYYLWIGWIIYGSASPTYIDDISAWEIR
jgi:hypothetical protein